MAKQTQMTKEEYLRKGKVSRSVLISGFAATFMAVIPIALTSTGGTIQNPLVLLCLIPGLVLIAVGIVLNGKVREGYKTFYLKPALREAFGEEYQLNADVSSDEILASGLFINQPHDQIGAGLSAAYRGVRVCAAGFRTYNVEEYEEYETDNDGNSKRVTKSRQIDRFIGLVYRLHTPAPAPVRIRLVQKKFCDSMGLTGGGMKDIYTGRDERLRDFVAYAEDGAEQQVLRALTPALLDAVEALAGMLPPHRLALDWNGSKLVVVAHGSGVALDVDAGKSDSVYISSAQSVVNCVRAPVDALGKLIWGVTE